jgi:MEMO1 family protein
MRVRRRFLPPGWYPTTEEETLREIDDMSRGAVEAPARALDATDAASRGTTGVAGIVPHAGWAYSGRLALEVFSCICPRMNTIVIIGGHLGPGDGIMCCPEDAFETPLGVLPADLELRAALRERLVLHDDRHADNTVEVHLPLVRHLAPGAHVLGLRAPPTRDAVELGKALARAAADLGRAVAVAGSTDLTHYGPGYGFAPAGAGPEGQRWVREVNDRAMVDALLALDAESALSLAARDRSACSVGGAVAALTWARERGAARGTLLRYMTSSDVHPGASFVGYAGIVYPAAAAD